MRPYDVDNESTQNITAVCHLSSLPAHEDAVKQLLERGIFSDDPAHHYKKETKWISKYEFSNSRKTLLRQIFAGPTRTLLAFAHKARDRLSELKGNGVIVNFEMDLSNVSYRLAKERLHTLNTVQDNCQQKVKRLRNEVSDAKTLGAGVALTLGAGFTLSTARTAAEHKKHNALYHAHTKRHNAAHAALPGFNPLDLSKAAEEGPQSKPASDQAHAYWSHRPYYYAAHSMHPTHYPY